jgi:hypothetical protein
MKLAILLLLFSFNLFAQVPAVQYFEMQKAKLAYFSNLNIDLKHDEIEQAIITVHGSERNADTYFRSIYALSNQRGVTSKTVVIAPQFKIVGDAATTNELVFSYEGWWIGDESLKAPRLSSFAVMDALIAKLASRNHFPKLKKITLTGHSAGGHLTQRYALGSRVDEALSHLQIRYIVANPGTYAYLNALRPVASTPGLFARPTSPGCDYNAYKYGLEKLNSYMSKNSMTVQIPKYLQKDVVYFLGEADTGSVEQTCQASLQGKNRYERGLNFYEHLTTYYPSHQHSVYTVPSVGHTQYGMYTSEIGKTLLFD